MSHTPGPWRVGTVCGSVVADTPVPEITGSDHVDYYGGHLVAESIAPRNQSIIAAAPDLYAVVRDFVDLGSVDQDDATLERFCVVCRASIPRSTAEVVSMHRWAYVIPHEPECSVLAAMAALDKADGVTDAEVSS